jgi:hypothetical protein
MTADLRVGQHDVPDDFPRRRADAVRRFLEHGRTISKTSRITEAMNGMTMIEE